MRKIVTLGFAMLVALGLSFTAAQSEEVDTTAVQAKVTGDIQYDYTYVSNDGYDNKAAFELRRARLGAETDLQVAEGKLLLDFSHLDDVQVTFAYAKFDIIEEGVVRLSAGAGRLPLQFAQVASTDNYQPNMRFPIERDLGFVDNNVDGIEGTATVGNEKYSAVGNLQYHNDIGEDLAAPNKDWNADLALNITQYVTFSVSYIENTMETGDLQAHTLWLHMGPVRIIGEHLAAGDGFNYNFDEKTDFFSVEGGVKIGSTKALELVARVDGDDGGSLVHYSAGVNWSFNDKLFLQGNVVHTPDATMTSGEDVLEGFKSSGIATRMTLLF